jgi:hypothetical protein
MGQNSLNVPIENYMELAKNKEKEINLLSIVICYISQKATPTLVLKGYGFS